MPLIVSCCAQFWERLRGRLDTTDTPPNVFPSRTHAGSSLEESGSRAISRMVVLAHTLFEVINLLIETVEAAVFICFCNKSNITQLLNCI